MVNLAHERCSPLVNDRSLLVNMRHGKWVLLRAVHELVGLAGLWCWRESFAANAGDFLVRLGSTRANQCILTGDRNGLTRFQMRFRHRMYQVWGCSVSNRRTTPLDAATSDKEMESPPVRQAGPEVPPLFLGLGIGLRWVLSSAS